MRVPAARAGHAIRLQLQVKPSLPRRVLPPQPNMLRHQRAPPAASLFAAALASGLLLFAAVPGSAVNPGGFPNRCSTMPWACGHRRHSSARALLSWLG